LKRLRMPSDVAEIREDAFGGVILERLELLGSRLSRAVAVRLRWHVASDGSIVGSGLAGRRSGFFGGKNLVPEGQWLEAYA
jgi:hypothetical protein